MWFIFNDEWRDEMRDVMIEKYIWFVNWKFKKSKKKRRGYRVLGIEHTSRTISLAINTAGSWQWLTQKQKRLWLLRLVRYIQLTWYLGCDFLFFLPFQLLMAQCIDNAPGQSIDLIIQLHFTFLFHSIFYQLISFLKIIFMIWNIYYKQEIKQNTERDTWDRNGISSCSSRDRCFKR